MRRRSWLIVLAVLATLVLLAIWLLGRLLQPERLTPVLLNAIGAAAGLELRVSEPADYALRPEPRLRLHGVSASAPGSSEPLLEIGLLDIALPWQTLFGDEAVITAVYADNARVYLTPVRAWLDQREETAQATWPTLHDGLRISNSTLVGEGWQLRVATIDLPRFALDQQTTLTLAGNLLRNDGDSVSDWPLRLTLDTTIARREGTVAFKPLQFVLDAASPLPSVRAKGKLVVGAMMQLKLDGELKQWPAQWPPLPGTDPSLPIVLTLDGTGPDLATMALAVGLEQTPTRLTFNLVPVQLQAWLDGDATSPLPPLTGELHAERMTIDGAELEGVDIQIEADAETDAEADAEP
jgi:uncharacterized protein involved in outer membrane biogenesis